MTARKHHARELNRVDGRSPCFARCGKAAGNPTWTASAYCADDQVHRPEVPGAGWQCPVCSVVWGTCSLFDQHQVINLSQPRAVRCLPPSELDVTLVRDSRGIWLTERGAASRVLSVAKLRAVREAADDGR